MQEQERLTLGRRAGHFGTLTNAVLCVLKIAVGILAASAALIADGLNNLTDAAASVVTTIGFRFAQKPADKEHPFGHARSEYLSALIVSVLILTVGVELLRTSAERILSPAELQFSALTLAVPLVSIFAKGALYLYYRKVERTVGSTALKAAGLDCLFDVAVTAAVLASLLVDRYTALHTDGFATLAVALFVLAGGVRLVKETVSPLLGEGVDPTLSREIVEFVKAQPEVRGCHDLLVHDYGPGRRYATLHAETAPDIDPLFCHEILDRTEREALSRFGVHLTIHHDPLPDDVGEVALLRRAALSVLRTRDRRINLHDFRIRDDENGRCISFDVEVPEELLPDAPRLKAVLEAALCPPESRRRLEVDFHL
ncbi:MAG: cation transporter [Clostridia bacterium]|nr:cation transporter [Clostridia bacterium]